MDLTPAPKKSIGRDSSGIALFMVIAAVSVLAILVTEFTYIAQISQMIAFGGLDQTQAHYLAKSGFKLSLLRLKAYQHVKDMISSVGGAGGSGGVPGVPKALIEKIWNFPFFYPIPTNIPGMSLSDKTAIETFQKDANMDGKFSALIESESSKYNLNLLLSSYAPVPTPGASSPPSNPPSPGGGTNPQPNSPPSPQPSFNPEVARTSLTQYLTELINQKIEADPDSADIYRDVKLDEVVDTIAAWADKTHERRSSSSHDPVPMKRAPFYSISELHMLPNIDDDLYNLFAPNLTTELTQGINMNTMKEPTLRALVPGMTQEEVADFFKFRDSVEVDNQFTDSDKFFAYIGKNVSSYKGNSDAITQLKDSLIKRNIILINEENQFKITVRAEVNQASRTLEAWVTLGKQSAPVQQPPPGQTLPAGQQPAPPDTGLKITYMRIL